MEIRINNLFSFLLLAHFSEIQVISQNFIVQTETLIQLEAPLFLTPFLEDKNIVEAREKARVHHIEMKGVESYSGYFTVNEDFDSNLFFWYFPSKGNSSTDPLILWLQGGPEASSLYGLFIGNGPFAIKENNTLEMRNITWINGHNVLYIDSPVGTGFSFTEDEADYASSVNNVTFNLYIGLQQFLILFPELRKNEFYVMGDSYAGKYVPALSYVIHKANEGINVENKINLAGLAIGNGNIDTINQLEYSDYLYHLGLIDQNTREKFRIPEAKIKDLIRKEKYIEATIAYDELVRGNVIGTTNLFEDSTGFKWPFNYLYSEEPESLTWYENWVQQRSVRNAIHVGDRIVYYIPRTEKYFPLSEKVNHFMAGHILWSVADVLEELLEHYRVLLYFGQLDIALSISISRKHLQQLHWSGSEEYKKAARNLWVVENKLAGYTKCAHNLTEVLVRNAGHMVPTDQPLWAWTMISHFTHHKPLC